MDKKFRSQFELLLLRLDRIPWDFQYKCLKDIYFPSEFYRPGEDIYVSSRCSNIGIRSCRAFLPLDLEA